MLKLFKNIYCINRMTIDEAYIAERLFNENKTMISERLKEIPETFEEYFNRVTVENIEETDNSFVRSFTEFGEKEKYLNDEMEEEYKQKCRKEMEEIIRSPLTLLECFLLMHEVTLERQLMSLNAMGFRNKILERKIERIRQIKADQNIIEELSDKISHLNVEIYKLMKTVYDETTSSESSSETESVCKFDLDTNQLNKYNPTLHKYVDANYKSSSYRVTQKDRRLAIFNLFDTLPNNYKHLCIIKVKMHKTNKTNKMLFYPDMTLFPVKLKVEKEYFTFKIAFNNRKMKKIIIVSFILYRDGSGNKINLFMRGITYSNHAYLFKISKNFPENDIIGFYLACDDLKQISTSHYFRRVDDKFIPVTVNGNIFNNYYSFYQKLNIFDE